MNITDLFRAILLAVIAACLGCGTIKGRTATDQLLVSDAVDQSISQVDFSPLSNSRVFLDTTYLKPVRGVGFVNSEYIISSLRERMVQSNCKLQDKAQDADYIVEVRVGALGTDRHEVNYCVPGSNAFNQTASLMTNGPMPSIPEISLARKDERRAAAKLAVFAYRRDTRALVWQTGSIQGVSLAQSTWLLGAGPFHKGSIYKKGDFDAVPIETPTSELVQPMIALMKAPFRGKHATVSETDELSLATTNAPPHLVPVPDNQQGVINASNLVHQSPNESGVVQASAELPLDDLGEFPESPLSLSGPGQFLD